MYTILHAEDDPTLAALMKFEIDAMPGVHVLVQREDGQSAFEYLALGNNVDLLITDWQMPKMDGITLIKKLRADERFTELPILLVSSMTDQELAYARSVGANMTLRKPIDSQRFRQAITSLLRIP